MKIKIVIIICIFSTSTAFSQKQGSVVIDTPTAYTIGKGMYQLAILGYDRGGMEMKSIIGLHDNLYLGVSFDVQSAIGKDKPHPNIPGVIARIKFTDGWERFPIAIAMGYDSFYSGRPGKTDNNINELNRMIYGPYIAVTSPIYLLDDKQFVSYGVRVPAQPYFEGNNTSYFISLDVPIGPSFRFKTEMERVYWDFSRESDWLMNFGIRYTYMDQLGIEFALMLQYNARPNRVIRIAYTDEF